MDPTVEGTATAGRPPSPSPIRHWIRNRLGIDKPIAFTILARVWSSSAGLVTLYLIARFLTPQQQGYYYTFGSLVALQVVFELGFSFVILQMATHERALLNFGGDGTITGDPAAHARLASVLQKAVRWYSVAAVLLAAFLLVAGSHFFATHRQSGAVVDWHAPWIAAALAAAVTFQLDPILSFMEGCGFVGNVAHVRFTQAMFGSLLAWSAMLLHHGLFAPSLVISGNAVIAFGWLCRHRKLLVPLLGYPVGQHAIHWIKEVWPFQWRIAVSWLCGYFIFQLFNPVLFAYRGAVVAGQMGMSLSLANALQAVAISWISTKAAPFGAMVARREFEQLDQMFFQALKQSALVCAAGSLVIVLGAWWLNARHLRFADRLLSPICLAGLLAVAAVNVIVFAEALYLRAHKQEKFLLNSVLGAVLVTASTYLLGKHYGATGIVVGNVIIALAMGLPYGTYVFMKYRRLWHGR